MRDQEAERRRVFDGDIHRNLSSWDCYRTNDCVDDQEIGEVLYLDVRVHDIGQVGPGKEQIAGNEPDIETQVTWCFDVDIL